MESVICVRQGGDGWSVWSRHREVVMIGANELTGDAGLEKAGQWQAWLQYTSLEGPC